MKENHCISCRRPRATLNCEVCHEFVCKDCVQFLENGTFSFRIHVPDELKHTYYCQTCFSKHIEPAQETYRESMEKAENAYIFFTTQRKPIPLIKKSKDKIQVDACDDRDETILRLAFQAAEQGYNAVIEVEVNSEKVRNEGYQKSRWRGKGVPANVDVEKMERHFD